MDWMAVCNIKIKNYDGIVKITFSAVILSNAAHTFSTLARISSTSAFLDSMAYVRT